MPCQRSRNCPSLQWIDPAAHGYNGVRVWFINVIVTEKARKRTMAQGKGTHRQYKILAACLCVVNTERSVYFEALCIWPLCGLAANHSRCRKLPPAGKPLKPSLRESGRQKHRQQSYNNSRHNTWHTDTKRRHFSEKFRAKEPKDKA